MEEIIGYLNKVIFHNQTNKYSVIVINIDDKKSEKVTVVGYFNIPDKSQLIKYSGEYITNKRFGVQFQVETLEIILPESKEGIIRYLKSSLFPGIGNVIATELVEKLGVDCLNIIANNPQILDTFSLSQAKKESIINGIERNKNMNDAIKLFSTCGISMKYLLKIDAIYKGDILKVINEDPYRMVKDVDGLGFKSVDKVALRLGISSDDKRRLKALICYTLKSLLYKTLDTYSDEESLYLETIKTVDYLDYPTFLELFNELRKSFDIVEDDYGRVFPYDFYEAEKGIANYLAPFINRSCKKISSLKAKSLIEYIEENEGIKYSDEQVDTIINVLNNNISIITGGPGTGKTTVLKAIVKSYARFHEEAKIILVAPTGRASKRMTELTGYPSCTIHRLLKWDLETNSFKIDEQNPVIGDFLIVDEFSMVDCLLFYNLLKGTNHFKKILLIGDDQQLEPLSPGNALKDLIDSGYINVNKLTINHRQEKNSGIIPLCMDAVNGILNEDNLYKDDVLFVPERSSNLMQKVLDLVMDEVDAGYTQNDIQVLSPMYEGSAGINNLNYILREYFNPLNEGDEEVRIGKATYRIGDKILQLKNQPDDNVFNGDIGYLIQIIHKDDEFKLVIDFDGNMVTYSKSEFPNISHAYAISVHKSQGSEFDCVIIPFTKEHNIMLKRKLIYTGLSRAKKKLIIVGDVNCLRAGLKRGESRIRKTTLKEKLDQRIKQKLVEN